MQASDTKFFHIGFYVAKIDPGTITLHFCLIHYWPAVNWSAYGSRRQLQLSKDQLIIKAGFDAKKESKD